MTLHTPGPPVNRPTPADLRAALEHLDGDGFAALVRADGAFVRAQGDARVGVRLEHGGPEGDPASRLLRTRALPLASALRAMEAFRAGSDAPLRGLDAEVVPSDDPDAGLPRRWATPVALALLVGVGGLWLALGTSPLWLRLAIGSASAYFVAHAADGLRRGVMELEVSVRRAEQPALFWALWGASVGLAAVLLWAASTPNQPL